MVSTLQNKNTTPAKISSGSWKWMLSSAILILVFVFFVVVTLQKKVVTQPNTTLTWQGSDAVAHSSTKNAFGALVASGSTTSSTGERGNATQNPIADSQKAVEGTVANLPIPYQMTTYTYAGPTPALPGKTVTVYRREPGFRTTGSSASVISGLSLDLLDLTKLKSPKIQMLTIGEDRDHGYEVYLDLTAGSISIQENWSRWPTALEKMATTPLTTSDLLTDNNLLSIANSFLDEYGISRSGYGAPVVVSAPLGLLQEGSATSAAPTKDMYIPDVQQVVYPFTIDNRKVYDPSGQLYGIQVSINAREGRVSSVTGLVSRNLTASPYDGVTDVARVLDVLKRGGIYGSTIPEGATSVTAEVGAPEQVFMLIQQANGQNTDELFVPALRFPVTKSPEGTYAQSSVIVPLGAEMLQQPDTTVKTLPVDGQGSGGAATGSTVIPPETITAPSGY